MTKEFKEYEKTIKKNYSFAFTPKYSEEIITNIGSKAFIPIVEKTLEKLGWVLVCKEENLIIANRKTESRFKSLETSTESITITYDHGKILIKSISLGNGFFDFGRNSKRVGLFIYAFQQTEKEFDKKELLELEKEVDKKNNWDDYIIPESLPQPIKYKKPSILFPIIAGFIISVFLGCILAFITYKGKYMIFLFEIGIAIIISYAFKYIIRFSNYIDFKKLNYIIIGMIILIYFLNEFFRYRLILNDYSGTDFSFLKYFKLLFEQGLTIDKHKTGWIGLVISWGIQLVLTWVISYFKLSVNLINYMVSKVPEEVTNFACYHFVKKKTEEQVRIELSKFGWKNKEDQDNVFESIGASQSGYELNKSLNN